MTKRKSSDGQCHHRRRNRDVRNWRIDFGVSGLLYDYLKHYGKDGMRDILTTLGHLAWEVKNEYYSINTKEELGITEGMRRNHSIQ